MAKFSKAVDIWTLDDDQRAALPIGQWVFAGERDNIGRFYGQGSSTVVAWLNNARGHGALGYRGYMAALRDYGRTVTSRK